MKQINQYPADTRITSMTLDYMGRAARWLAAQKWSLITICEACKEDNPDDSIDLYAVRVITKNGLGDIKDMLLRVSSFTPTAEVVEEVLISYADPLRN